MSRSVLIFSRIQLQSFSDCGVANVSAPVVPRASAARAVTRVLLSLPAFFLLWSTVAGPAAAAARLRPPDLFAQTGGTQSLGASPASASFGTVALNAPTVQTVTVTSSGTRSVSVRRITCSGTAFQCATSATTPVSLSPGQSIAIQVTFNPTVAGAASGSLVIHSTSRAGATISIPLSGSGGAMAQPVLTLSTSSLNFGSDPVGTAVTQTVTLSSAGNAAVAVSAGSITGAGFAMSGGTFPVTLNPGVAVTLTVQFDPSAAGTDSGAVQFTSDSSTGGSSVVLLSGTGTAAQHEVQLSWAAPTNSTDPVAGYNVYRAPSGSSSFQVVNASMEATTTYTDTTVQTGMSYAYYVVSVDSSGNDSTPSNQISVTIP